MWAALKNWFTNWNMSPEERYLGESADHKDFECRLKEVEEKRLQQSSWQI